MAESKGYLTSFKSTTMINHSALCATSPAALSKQVNAPIETLPNGTKVYYNGTSDSTVAPGNASQAIWAKSGGEALLSSLMASIGNYGALTLSKVAGGTSTCNAIMNGVSDNTRMITGTAHIQITVTFELLDNWT